MLALRKHQLLLRAVYVGGRIVVKEEKKKKEV